MRTESKNLPGRVGTPHPGLSPRAGLPRFPVRWSSASFQRLPSSSPGLPRSGGRPGTSAHTPQPKGAKGAAHGRWGGTAKPHTPAGAHLHPAHDAECIQGWEERSFGTCPWVSVLSPQDVQDWPLLLFVRARKTARGERIQERKTRG